MREKVLTILLVVVIWIFIGVLFFLWIELRTENSVSKPKYDVSIATFFKQEDVYVDETKSFKKPVLQDNYIDTFINNYISNNSCTYLDYKLFLLNEETVNVFLNCGNPESKIFKYQKRKEINFDTFVKNKDLFVSNVKRLLNLKYPTFVTDEVDVLNGQYEIYNNEIIAYYNTLNYGAVKIKINYNEVKDLLSYSHIYDEFYENEVYVLDPNKKTVAFTFDDGPGEYEDEIINILVDAHASASFFLVGYRMESYLSNIQKIIDNNMEIGNHTYNHKSLTSLSNTEISNEINKTNAKFNELTGKHMTLLRPSYGAIDRRVLLEVKMPVVLWNIDTLDWLKKDALYVKNHILEKVDDGDIVLMHSLYPTTVEAVKDVLPELYKMGYQVTSVGELARLKGKDLQVGITYGRIT